MASFIYKNVYINNYYSVAGKYENNGNLKGVNRYLKDFYDNEATIEDCEIKIQREVLSNLINKKTELICGGDLSNQLSLSSYSVKDLNISFLGVYSACASFISSIIILANSISGKLIKEGLYPEKL